ncbi:MAG: hypothetical protein Q4C95_12390 [Planctomycetia bacterium]|nr:hypothetical protein [Planctomycetia bacterium]
MILEYGGKLKSPFRIANVTKSDPNAWIGLNVVASWKSRDSMSWWADGTTNQLLIGEKHMPNYLEYGQCVHAGECSYLYGAGSSPGELCINSARTFDKPEALIIPEHCQVEPAGETHIAFGAPHAGSICNFLIGDGSVHAIPATTSIKILRQLSCVSDGHSVVLP